MFSWFEAFWLYFFFRYFRLAVNLVSHWTFKPIAIPEDPSYGAEDVTIIIPTLDGDNAELRETIEGCLHNNPFEIILVTIDANYHRAMALREDFAKAPIRIFSIPQANKRLQMCRAIPEVLTKITVLADDDVSWPSTILAHLLAPFEDDKMGGVGTCQRLKRAVNPTPSQRFWNFLGALYLERRNFDISACTHMDGGLPCLSGRTVAYRTGILQEYDFQYEFTHETWWAYQMNADDDNFITRWMVSHGWKTYIQYTKQAELTTTLEDNSKFLKQCLRWSRSNWRSNITSMFQEGHVWIRQPWSTYAVQQTTLTAWALPNDILVFFLLYKAAENWSEEVQTRAFIALGIFVFVSKWIKLVGHYIRYPVDIVFLPVSIIFGYLHGIIKFLALLTLSNTTWGSRENADTDDAVRMVKLPRYTTDTDMSDSSSSSVKLLP